MIDHYNTQIKFGYDSTKLTSGSHRLVIAICNKCKKHRNVQYCAYRDYCRPCSRTKEFLSQEELNKRSLAMKGAKNPFYGRKHSKKSKLKISNSIKCRPKKNPEDCAFRKLLYIYKKGAEKRNLVFSLTDLQMLDLFKSQCFYCKKLPSNICRRHPKSIGFVYNGIDRKDNDLGYTLENCVPCCMQCNLSKRNISYKEFISWIKELAKNIDNL